MDFNGTFTQALDELVQRVLPSLVIIRGRRWGAGAGIVWSADGLILTNNHVVGRRAPIVKLQDDGEYESRLLARDPNVDLALLSIEASHLTPLVPASVSPPFSSGVSPRIGEMVFAFGHPWGQRNTVTRGIISAMLTAQSRNGKKIPIIRSDVPLAPGNSGGPLVNVRGEVLGLNAMIMGGDQSIAIPVSVMKDFVDKALSGKKNESRREKPIPEGVL